MARCIGMKLNDVSCGYSGELAWFLGCGSQGWMDDRLRGHTPGLTPWRWFQLIFEK
jgi:hypothetical protein